MAAMEDELNVLLKKLQSQEKVLLYIFILFTSYQCPSITTDLMYILMGVHNDCVD